MIFEALCAVGIGLLVFIMIAPDSTDRHVRKQEKEKR